MSTRLDGDIHRRLRSRRGTVEAAARRHVRALGPAPPRRRARAPRPARRGPGPRPRPARAAPGRPDRHRDPGQRRPRGVGGARGRLEQGELALAAAAVLASDRADRGAARPAGRPQQPHRRCPAARRCPGPRRDPPVAVDGPCLAIRRFAPAACRSRPSPRRPVVELLEPRCGRGPTSSSAAPPRRGRPRCSTHWPASPHRGRADHHHRGCGRAALPAPTSCGWRLGRVAPKASAR